MAALLVALAGWALYQPAGNPDIVDYVATAHSWEGARGQALSDATYGDLRAFLSPTQYADVTGAGDPSLQRNVYLRTLRADPEALTQQIPFYSVKPLYPGLMVALHATGVPLPLGSVLISVAAMAALGVLVFAWVRRYHGPLLALVLAGLLMASPPFAVLGTLSTPDGLALLLVAAAAFALMESRRPGVAILLLALAVLARPNAVIFGLALLAAGALAQPATGIRLRPAVAAASAAVLVGIVLAVSRLVGGYPYGVLFWNSFYTGLAYPVNGAPPVSLRDIARLYVGLGARLTSTLVPLIALLGAVALRLRLGDRRGLRGDPLSLLACAALVAGGVGWLAFPNEADRMLVGSYLAVAIVLVASAGRRPARAA